MSDTSVTIRLPLPGSRGRWLAAGLVAGLVVAGLASPLFSAPRLLASNPSPTANEHTISVGGTGRVVLTPDTADLRLGVSVTAPTVKAARADAAARMTAVIAALKKLGIADKDIQTSFVTLQPQYDYSAGTNPPRLTGYQFGNGVAVTIRDLDKVGDTIDGALAAGATNLDSVSFRVADETAAADHARQAAMADAKTKAQTLATAAGVSITGVASISETVAPVPYPVYYGAAASGAVKDVATPIQAGTSEVSVSVTVVYLIG